MNRLDIKTARTSHGTLAIEPTRQQLLAALRQLSPDEIRALAAELVQGEAPAEQVVKVGG